MFHYVVFVLCWLIAVQSRQVAAQTNFTDGPGPLGERVYCDGNIFGRPISRLQVEDAMRQMPEGDTDVIYHFNYPGEATYHLPLRYTSSDGSVVITVDRVGSRAVAFKVSPDAIRRAVAWIARRCLTNGGFSTLGRKEAILFQDYYYYYNWYSYASADSPDYPPPFGDNFLGISMTTDAKKDTDYGNRHTTVWMDIVSDLRSQGGTLRDLEQNQYAATKIIEAASDYRKQLLRGKDGSRTESEREAEPSSMPHQCDAAKYGVPKDMSCRQLLSRLRGDERLKLTTNQDNLQREAGCVIRVRAQTAISVAWEVIKEVVEALLSLCGHNPRVARAGGIADGSTLFSRPPFGNGSKGVYSSNQLLPPGITVQVDDLP